MKYLYYTLHLFFVKIIHLEKQYPPIINITAVISTLIIFFVFSIVNAYRYGLGDKYPKYSTLIPIIGTFILWKILYDYYKPREAKLLKEMDSKPLWVKIIIVVMSTCFIVLVVKLWMFDGMYEIFEFIKRKC